MEQMCGNTTGAKNKNHILSVVQKKKEFRIQLLIHILYQSFFFTFSDIFCEM